MKIFNSPRRRKSSAWIAWHAFIDVDYEVELKYVEWNSDLSIALEDALGRYIVKEDLDENGLHVPND